MRLSGLHINKNGFQEISSFLGESIHCIQKPDFFMESGFFDRAGAVSPHARRHINSDAIAPNHFPGFPTNPSPHTAMSQSTTAKRRAEFDGAHVPHDGNPGRSNPEDGWLTRERSLALALLIATGIVGYLCYRLILPFFPSLAWALALAVIANPVHRKIKNWFSHPSLSAGLSVLLVALLFITPAIFVTQHLVREASKATVAVQDSLSSGRWHAYLKHPRLKPVERWIESQFGLASEISTESAEVTDSQAGDVDPQERKSGANSKSAPVERVTTMLADRVGTVITGTGLVVMQLFVTCMTLFFFFRDRSQVLGVLRSLIPLSGPEATEVFDRVDQTIHATVYGSVVVAVVQGSMGGLMFWLLGLPSPVMWGAIMALLAVVPVLGTFVIWAPTAAYLALRGDVTKALILAAWGGIAIGLIDNLLYPFLVGTRIRFHTLLIFFAIVGGLALFGASGVILGPLLLALADALLDIWRRRTARGGTVEKTV